MKRGQWFVFYKEKCDKRCCLKNDSPIVLCPVLSAYNNALLIGWRFTYVGRKLLRARQVRLLHLLELFCRHTKNICECLSSDSISNWLDFDVA